DSSASLLFENMMLLKYVEIANVNHRQISVLKLRENGYDPANHVMTISDAGISVDGTVSDLVRKNAPGAAAK
ncbi:MAG: recombinase RecA, partial [Noviherbaspirillum sp.]